MEKKDATSIEKKLKRVLPLEFLLTIAQVFNPNAYEELSNRTLKNVFSYFFSIMFASYVLMILVSLPVLINFESTIAREFAKFDEFVVDFNISMSEPIYIKQLGLGIDGTGDKELTTENILITQNFIQSKNPACFFKPLCLLKKDKVNKIDLNEYTNLVDKSQDFVAWLALLAVFLLPWILINLFFALFLKYMITIILLTGFGVILTRLVNRRIKMPRIFKVAMYAVTPMVILDTVNIPLGFNLLYLPFVITLIYFIVGLILASERGFKK